MKQICYHPNNPTHPKISNALKLLNAIPSEGIAFLVGSLAVRILSPTFASPLLGIGISLITATLVLKSLECYDSPLLINLTKETCKLSKKYPKIQMITCICALAFSLISKTFSFFIGAALGSFASIILDVERYKLMQQANRSRPN
ncbi:MAG TPA: hypothetical protein VGP47_05175 [Parachlamydiaceae bacterium]|nr:hypothetical protein [Parachlamydiaceae bacterium]